MLRHKITQYHSVPFVFRELLHLSRDPMVFASVRQVLLTTDRVFSRDVELFRQRFAATTLFSTGLGSTEAKLFCHWFVPRDRPMGEPIVPVGRRAAWLRNRFARCKRPHCAAGQVGEMVITSQYLARGYWSPRENTERSFPSRHPTLAYASSIPATSGGCDKTVFSSWLERKDRQIKIRGNRSRTGGSPGNDLQPTWVVDAAVISRDSGEEAEIVAFVVPTASTQLTVAELAGWLRDQLPNAMQPRQIHLVEAIPMLGNYKQDIQKLQELDRELSSAPKPTGAPSALATRTASGHKSGIHDAVRAEWAHQVGAGVFDADITWSEAGEDISRLWNSSSTSNRPCVAPSPWTCSSRTPGQTN